jgi:hypothetical protein
MTHCARLTCCAALVGLPVLVACVVRPTLLADFGLDPSAWSVWAGNFDHQMERQQQLKRRLENVNTATRLKRELCRELIAGRVTLAHTACRFCELADRPEAEFLELIRREFPAETDEETLGRHVISWVCNQLDDDPVEQDAVRRRLEEELERQLQRSPDGGQGFGDCVSPAPSAAAGGRGSFTRQVS